MNCDTLPPPSDLSYTGFPLAVVLLLGGACLLAGVLLLVLARNRRGRTAALAITMLLLSAGLSASRPGISSAEPTDGSSCITIIQTSPLTGLAPGIAPAPIAGQLTNHWADTILVSTVTVSIASVTKAPGSREGTCDTSDFILSQPDMPLGVTIEHGGTADFSGALIGFNDKSVNQDACQGATVELHYLSS